MIYAKHLTLLYDGSLFRAFQFLKGAELGRILALFMYKVYINGLLNELNNHNFGISIDGLTLFFMFFLGTSALEGGGGGAWSNLCSTQ